MEYDVTQCTMENICRFIDENLEKDPGGNVWMLQMPDMINALANLMSARAKLIKAEFDINAYKESSDKREKIWESIADQL